MRLQIGSSSHHLSLLYPLLFHISRALDEVRRVANRALLSLQCTQCITTWILLIHFAMQSLYCSASISTPRQRTDKFDLQSNSRHSRTRAQVVDEANRYVSYGMLEEAQSLCDDVLNDWHDHAGCLMIRSKIHLSRGEHSKARQAIRDSIDQDPTNQEARRLLAHLLIHQAAEFFSAGDTESAYEGYRQVILMDMYETKLPIDMLTEVYFNMGHLLESIGMNDEALLNFQAVTRLDVHNFRAYAAIVDLLVKEQQGPADHIIDAVKAALRVHGTTQAPGMWAMLLDMQLQRCDWTSRHQDVLKMTAMLQSSKESRNCEVPPLLSILLFVEAPLAFHCSVATSIRIQAHHHPLVPRAVPLLSSEQLSNFTQRGILENGMENVLKVAFLSGVGFGDDNVAGHMLQGLLELHNRSRISVACISYSVADNSSVFRRIERGCDEFHTIGPEWDPEQAVLVLTAVGAHILVHISGLSDEHGIASLAFRAAPLQMTWYGYEASLGADFVNTMISDNIASPPDFESLYSEALLYLPKSEFVHRVDPTNSVQLQPKCSREEAGLRKESLVFGCLSPAQRIDPELFVAWMELLRVMKNSQLWIFQGVSQVVKDNLHAQAAQCGIVSGRIVVSDNAIPIHSTIGLVDLYLDTRTLNADTANVAEILRAGGRVLTLPCEYLGRRTSASLLLKHAGGRLFIARDIVDYEEIAIRIAKAFTSNSTSYPHVKQQLPLDSKPPDDDVRARSRVDEWERGLRMVWEVAGAAKQTAISSNVGRGHKRFHVIVMEVG